MNLRSTKHHVCMEFKHFTTVTPYRNHSNWENIKFEPMSNDTLFFLHQMQQRCLFMMVAYDPVVLVLYKSITVVLGSNLTLTTESVNSLLLHPSSDISPTPIFPSSLFVELKLYISRIIKKIYHNYG